jgi:molybdenum cofactor synthesis domain-containing protein
MNGTVTSVNISKAKGTTKKPVLRARVTGKGIATDAHAGSWHRQVSLLSRESVAALSKECGRDFAPGEFAENISTSGIDLGQVCLGDRFKIGRVALEVTQIGKACHGSSCAIFQEVGRCVMPKQGIFTRVLHGGEVRPGDSIELIPRPLRILAITLSDRASRGEYEDRSGPAARALLETHFTGSHWRAEIQTKLIPDSATRLRALIRLAVKNGVDAVFTLGGTGIGPRDITPDVVRPLLDKEIPGIMEHIRLKYGGKMPAALLSRSVAGVIGSTLLYTLPGSVRATEEYLGEILKSLDHALTMLRGIDDHQ